MISRGVEISIAGGGGEMVRVRGWRVRRGPYIDFADAVHFDDCESYGLSKEGMRLKVYRDVAMSGATS